MNDKNISRKINENLNIILEKIERIKNKLNINYDIKLMAVSKTKPVEDIMELIESGQILFGENRIVEAFDKFTDPRLKDRRFELHIIGHLQRNKIRKALEISNMIQSVDKIETLDEIENQCNKINKKIDYLIEVNTSNESQKYGVDPNNFNNLLDVILKKEYNNCNLRGLMTVGPFTDQRKEIAKAFKILFKIYNDSKESLKKNSLLKKDYDTISMGMSNDFEIAIEEGSNLLRIGSLIFGNR